MVPQYVLNQLLSIMNVYPAIQKILLFGSRAYGDHGERSDIDLAIVAPFMSEVEWLEFSEKIEEMETLLKIDLIKWETAPANLQNEIKKCNKILYSK